MRYINRLFTYLLQCICILVQNDNLKMLFLVNEIVIGKTAINCQCTGTYYG